jgi:hypothetical protein
MTSRDEELTESVTRAREGLRTNEECEETAAPNGDSSLSSFVRSHIPVGFVPWSPASAEARWPSLDGAVWLGPVGDFLTLVAPQTEASPAAVGVGALVRYGTLLGHRVVLDVGEHRHHANLFAVVVGETSTGAKGTADIANRPLFDVVDSSLDRDLAVGGFGSGEALVADLADSDEDATVRRRLIHEAESPPCCASGGASRRSCPRSSARVSTAGRSSTARRAADGSSPPVTTSPCSARSRPTS